MTLEVAYLCAGSASSVAEVMGGVLEQLPKDESDAQVLLTCCNIALKGVFDRRGLDSTLFGAYDRKGAD